MGLSLIHICEAADAPADGVYQAVCRFCGCGCGMLCEVKDGVLVGVAADPDNRTNRGMACVKGYHLAKILYGDDRLTVPLVRDDPSTKGTPEGLREATWEEALDLVAAKLRETWKADKMCIRDRDNAASPRLADTAERDYFTLRARLIIMQKQLEGAQLYIREQCLR